MALVLTEPFDNLTSAPWAGSGTPTIVAGRTGTGVQLDGINERIDYTITAPGPTYTIGVAYRTSSLGFAQDVFILNRSGTNENRLLVTTTGGFQVTRGTSTTIATSALGLIAVDTWYYIEFQVYSHSTVGQIVVRLNGVSVATFTGNTRSVGDPNELRLFTAQATTVKTYDDLYLRNDTTFQGDPALPPAITDLTATQTQLDPPKVRLEWSPVDNVAPVTRYQVDRTSDNVVWTVLSSTVTDPVYEDSPPTEVTYGYRVSGVNSIGTGSASNTAALQVQFAPTGPGSDRSWWPEGYDLPAFRVKRQTYGLMTGGDWTRGSSVSTLPHTALRYPSSTAAEYVEAASQALILATPFDYHTVEILWGWPTVHTDWLEVAVVRSTFGHPSTPRDGMTVFRALRERFNTESGVGILPPPTIYDQPLPSGHWYYYTVFFRTNNVEWVAAMSDGCVLPRDFKHRDYMWDAVPPYYRWIDDNYRYESGHLRQFLAVFGFAMDNVREFVEGLGDLHQIDKTPMALLKGLGANYGLPYEAGIGDIRYRGLVANAPNAQHTRGTTNGVEHLIEAVSKYKTDISGSRTLILFPDDSDFKNSTGNWGGPHPDTIAPIIAQEATLTSLTWDKIFVARVNSTPQVGRGVMRVYTAKADETTSLIIMMGDSRIRDDGDPLLQPAADTVPPPTAEYRDATPLMAGVPIQAGTAYGFSFWVQAPEKIFDVYPFMVWVGPSGAPLEVVDVTAAAGPEGLALGVWEQIIVQGIAPAAGALPEARYLVPGIQIRARTTHTLTNRSAAIDICGAMVYEIGRGDNTPVSVAAPDEWLTLGIAEEVLGAPGGPGAPGGFEGSPMGAPLSTRKV